MLFDTQEQKDLLIKTMGDVSITVPMSAVGSEAKLEGPLVELVDAIMAGDVAVPIESLAPEA